MPSAIHIADGTKTKETNHDHRHSLQPLHRRDPERGRDCIHTREGNMTVRTFLDLVTTPSMGVVGDPHHRHAKTKE